MIGVITALAVAVPMSASAQMGDKLVEPAGALQGASRSDRPVQIAEPPPPPPPPTTAAPTPPAPTTAREAQQILDLVNRERTSRGLRPVRLQAQLNSAAQAHSADQARSSAIYHTHPRTGAGPGDRISATGYSFSTWGENVAAGQQTAAAVMQAWMNSPGHCRNILNPAFTELGVGHEYRDDDPKRYRRYWTQKFARPRGEPAPGGNYDPSWC